MIESHLYCHIPKVNWSLLLLRLFHESILEVRWHHPGYVYWLSRWVMTSGVCLLVIIFIIILFVLSWPGLILFNRGWGQKLPRGSFSKNASSNVKKKHLTIELLDFVNCGHFWYLGRLVSQKCTVSPSKVHLLGTHGQKIVRFCELLYSQYSEILSHIYRLYVFFFRYWSLKSSRRCH